MTSTTSILFNGFTEQDFEVFHIPGLEQRMEALKERIQPKFNEIGQALVGDISALIGEPCFVHVAKHARRKVNPPNDSWLSFATSPRGYKMLPHFQIGLWATHVFIQFAIIYECPRKVEFGEKLIKKWNTIKKEIPNDFHWLDDHINPKPILHQDADQHIERLTQRLIRSKKAEILCGTQITREQAIHMSGEDIINQSYQTIKKLMPLYRLLK